MSAGVRTTLLLYRRLVRQEALSVPTFTNLGITLFFLAAYVGAFGDAPTVEVERITGTDFVTFILPVSILNASIAGASAGQLLVADLESGSLRRLLTIPVPRTTLVHAPMLVGATFVTVQAALVLGLGVVLGADVETGPAGALVLLALALLWGLAFAGYFVASGLLAGNAAAAQAAAFLFFPLIFLAPTFLPRVELHGWLETASAANPTTYVLEATRGLLATGWDGGQLATGFVVIGGLGSLALWWAASVARRTTSRA